MKKYLLVLPLVIAATAAVTWLASLYVFERPVFSELVEQKQLDSRILNETRQYLVHLPASYREDSARRYPVIYVLDGSSQDVHTADSAALLARIGLMPEVIVVGIPNVSGEGRQRDYTPPYLRQDTDETNLAMGGGDAFLAFLRDELIPLIERDYRTESRRMLAGHSRGGLFVVYALTAAPDLFDAYFAHSPALWRDDHAMISRLRDFLAQDAGTERVLFLSLGSDENDKMRAAYDEAVALLSAAPARLTWRAYASAAANHRLNPVYATPVGLHWLYTDVLREGNDTASVAASPGAGD